MEEPLSLVIAKDTGRSMVTKEPEMVGKIIYRLSNKTLPSSLSSHFSSRIRLTPVTLQRPSVMSTRPPSSASGTEQPLHWNYPDPLYVSIDGDRATVGASGTLFGDEVMNPDFRRTPQHSLNHILYQSCTPYTVDLPRESISALVNNAIEGLSDADYSRLKAYDPEANVSEANDPRGLDVLTANLRATLETLANTLQSRPDMNTQARLRFAIAASIRENPRTERTANVRLHTAKRILPMALHSYQPTSDSAVLPSVVMHRAREQPSDGSINLARITVKLPCAVKTLRGSHASVTNDPAVTVNERALSGWVDSLVGLEPDIRAAIGPWTRGQDGHTEESAQNSVLPLIQNDIKPYLRYGTTALDFAVPENRPDRPGSTTARATSGWRVQDGRAKPTVTVLASQRRESRP